MSPLLPPSVLNSLSSSGTGLALSEIEIPIGSPTPPQRGRNEPESVVAAYVAALNDALLAAGVTAGRCVALHLPRGAEAVLCILALRQIGAAYLPLDPAHPLERLQFMLDDSEPALLFCRTRSEAALRFVRGPVWFADDPGSWTGKVAADGERLPEDSAYVIYTSGSTGRPKGVVCRWAAVVNLLEDLQRKAPLAPGDACMSWSNLSFDVSVYEIAQCILQAGRMVFVPAAIHADGPALMPWLQARGIRAGYLPPMLVGDLLAWCRSHPGACGLKRLLVGVEPIPLGMLREIERLAPGLRIINGYGPTETTICSTLYVVSQDHGPDHPGRRAPIGTAVAGTELHIVDGLLQPVPEGQTGELLIGGAGLAHGYLKRPTATQERFVSSPLTQPPGGRLYRTGDLVRRLADGNLEFVGRADGQIKLLGVRIETGEVESVLLQHPQIREAIVHLGELRGVKRLAAYLTLAANADPAAVIAALRTQCTRALPRVMHPTAWVILPTVPMTPHGKVDRAALPPLRDADTCERLLTAPADAFEGRLLEDIREVLGGPPMGVDDDFLECGGNSLLAARLAHRLAAASGTEVSLLQVLQHPTARALAACLRRADGTAAEAMPVAADQTEAPLSSAQMRQWYLSSLDPDDPAFNIVLAWHITGPFDPDRLQQALDAVVAAQPSLRTRFTALPGQADQPVQQVVAEARVVLNVHRVADRAAAERLAAQRATQPFALAQAPLVRADVVPVDDGQILLLVMHHIISDGWSVELILRELARVYAAPAARPTRPVRSYIDYSAWQQSDRGRDAWPAQLRHWETTLADLPALLPLPVDKPRPATASARAGSRRCRLDVHTARQLDRLAREHRTTPYNVLLAAVYLLLHRLTGEADLCVGTFHANRERAEIEHTVGFFINTLALRCRVEETETAAQLLERVAQVSRQALQNGAVPFERVLHALRVERSLAHSPLFQVMFVFQNLELTALDLAGCTCHPQPISTGRTLFDLTWWITPGSDGMDVVLDYRADLFDPATAERWLRLWRRLVTALAAAPNQPLADIPTLTGNEADQLAAFGQPEDADLAVELRPLADLLAQRLAVSPRADAIRWQPAGAPGQTAAWSAPELLAHAQRLATLVAPGQTVALCLHRSPSLVAAQIGTWLAGGTVVVLDPTYPEPRLAHILHDCGATLLLHDTGSAGLLSASRYNLRRMNLDTVPPAPAAAVQGGDLEQCALIVYTSGSTGTPRGVRLSQRNLTRFAQRAAAGYGIGPTDVVLQFSSPGFDASLEEIYPALLVGAGLVLRSEEAAGDAAELIRLVERWGVTVLDLPTAYFCLALAAPDAPALPPCIRSVIIGGEKAPAEHVTRFLTRYPHVHLHNTYGPTECTVVCTRVEVTPERLNEHGGEVPIGRPCFGAVATVRDRRGRLQPPGVFGELWIAGDGVTAGYHNQADTTAARFTTDEQGRRCYRTGDLVRWRLDGHLDYAGRLDRQIKLHGYRIEPAEIEEACCRVPGVRHSVVVARGDGPRQTLLACLAADTGLLAAEVRRRLLERLPEFMVPAEIVLLPELPMTPGGKLDLAAVRRLPGDTPAAASAAPANPIETALCEVWQHLLGRPAGIDDDFFDLGGHSLLIMEMISRAARYGLALTPAAVMRNRTIRRLAAVVATGEREGILVRLADGVGCPLFLVHSTPGDVLGYAHLVEILGRRRPVFGLECAGLTEPDRVHRTIPEMATAYIQAMKRVCPQGPYCIAGWCYGGVVASEMAVQLRQAGESVASLILIETPTPNSSRRPLILAQRALSLLRLGPLGVFRWTRGKWRYRRLVNSGAMQRGFHLDIDSGILKNRALVSTCNLRAGLAYRQDTHPGPLHLISGDQLEDGAIPNADWGWTRRGISVTRDTIPGTHESILKPPQVERLAAAMERYLPGGPANG